MYIVFLVRASTTLSAAVVVHTLLKLDIANLPSTNIFQVRELINFVLRCSKLCSAGVTQRESSNRLVKMNLFSYNMPLHQTIPFSTNRRCPSHFSQGQAYIQKLVVRSSMHSNEATEADVGYMRHCIQLARKALGHTSPNPMVGCVIVKDGNIIGEGFHPKAGEPHAEVFALRAAGSNARGSTAYVSLEPCNHYGRTPPCTGALIQAQVKRVIVGMLDPNPIVAGKGINALKKAGIEVVVDVEASTCQALNEAYIHRMLQRKPFATLRFSSSLDGAFLETPVNCAEGSYFSQLLQENDAIILSDTAFLDNPTIVTSEPGARQPLRIVLTDTFEFLPECRVFDTSVAPTMVIASEQAVLRDSERNKRKYGQTLESIIQEKGVEVVALKELNLDAVLDLCYERGFCAVLVDSRGQGNMLAKQALVEKVVQKLVIEVSPILCGGSATSLGFTFDKDVESLERLSSKMSGQNVIIEGYFKKTMH